MFDLIMKIRLFVFFVIAFSVFFCSFSQNNSSPLVLRKSVYKTTILDKNTQQKEVNNQFYEIKCDSIYKGQFGKITLSIYDTLNTEDETVNNAVFTLYKFKKGYLHPFFRDSIFCKYREVKFEDYNNDGVRDILIQHYSSARSNLSYYLYIVDLKNNRLNKIKGFENIPNPKYLSKYKLVEGFAVSGVDWTKFYKIKGNAIRDLGIMIYDNHTENSNYEREYKKSIERIMKSR